MDDAEPKRRGRPPKAPADRKGGNITFRAHPDFRAKLEDAAAQSGRTITQEVELRVERSFRDDDLRALIREEVRAALAIAAPERRPCGRLASNACPQQSPYSHLCQCQQIHGFSTGSTGYDGI